MRPSRLINIGADGTEGCGPQLSVHRYSCCCNEDCKGLLRPVTLEHKISLFDKCVNGTLSLGFREVRKKP